MKGVKQREYHRLAFPSSYRPSLMIDVDSYEIEDVSEYGMKIHISEDPAFMVDDNIMAIIAFPDGKEFDLSGQVVRIDEGFAGLKLETPLPLTVILSEYFCINNTYSN